MSTSMMSLGLNVRPQSCKLGVARSRSQRRVQSCPIVAGISEPGSLVLVAGATGGVGQLLTAKLLERGYRVRAMSRNVDSALALFGAEIPKELEVVKADCRDPSSLPAAVEGVDAVVCCTGTTAFPSKRWQNNNGPKETDYEAVKNLIGATPKIVHRFVLTTSAGVDRSDQFPWKILNAFGVLKYKKAAEELLRASGLPYTILRPNRLTDGPYTSYDLNTLLKGTAGTRRDVQLSLKDDQLGEASRISVAEAIVQLLAMENTENKAFALTSTEGDGPGEDVQKWKALFNL